MRTHLARAALLLATAACAPQGNGSTPDTSDTDLDAGAPAVEGGGAPEASGDDGDAGPPQSFLRVAHLSTDLPPIDVCVAPHGTTTFQGPLIGQLASTVTGTDAASPGLGYAQVSAYLSLAPGQYDVRVVSAGAADCSSGVSDTTSLTALEDNAHATLLIAGELQPTTGDRALTALIIPDDATIACGAASLRAVNAMPAAATLDFGFGSFASAWTPLFAGASFASAAATAGRSAGTLDSNGYLPMAPVTTQVFSARASSGATGDILAVEQLSIEFGAIVTVVAIGKASDDTHPAALLFCTDNSPSGGLLSDCSIQQ
jgi:hypothetical protein